MNNFDHRIKCFSEENIISPDVANSIRKSHEYRNQYLHKLKINETDCIAHAKLYFHLLQHPFVKIPINFISSTDDKSEIAKYVSRESRVQFSSEVFRSELVSRLNTKHNISFVLSEFIDISKDFLSTKYSVIVDAMHFLIENYKEEAAAIKLLENRCRSGKVSVIRIHLHFFKIADNFR